jgi:secreted PhoX family phosphatase
VNAIIQTKDEGYLFVSNTESTDGDVSGNHGSVDAWVVKLDADGNIQWQKCFGGTKLEAVERRLTSVEENLVATREAVLNIGDRFVPRFEFDALLPRFNQLDEKVRNKLK